MSYKAGIIKAITELKNRTGSSYIAIKKHMQANMGDKKWLNGVFLKALKDGVASGEFVKVKASYKLSAAEKAAAKKKSASKKEEVDGEGFSQASTAYTYDSACDKTTLTPLGGYPRQSS